MEYMQNLLKILENVLKKDDRLVIEGVLAKNKIMELALALDASLLKLLLSDKALKSHFFTEVEKTLVFDKQEFIRFVNNKNFLPDSYTSFKNKIGLMAEEGTYMSQSKDVVLAFPYKDCVLEGGQDKEDAKRSEIFWNETLAPDEIDRLLDPKVFTNFKKYDKNGEKEVRAGEVDFEKENLIIKGNNLLALHSLEKRYSGQVKLIYIDPPYNSENDSFRYNDSFTHSTWLTFMTNRLKIAKEMLKSDGVIFIQSDDNEQAYLKILLDDIFERENFVNTISVNMKNVAGASGGGEDKKLKKNIEYIHIYAKDYSLFNGFNNVFKLTPIIDIVKEYRELDVSWKYTSVLVYEGDKKYVCSTNDGSGEEIKIFTRKNSKIKSIKQLMKEEKMSEEEVYIKYAKRIFQTAMPQSSIRPRVMSQVKKIGIESDLYSIEYVPKSGKNKGNTYEQFYKGESFRLFAWLGDISEEIDGVLFKKDMQGTYWDLAAQTKNLSKEGRVELLSGKKPEKLLQNIIEMCTLEDELVLDFHLGSGTTCAVAHKMNRRYIGIEQLDYGENDNIVRLKNVVDGDQTGISKSMEWKGGGSFVHCELLKLNQSFADEIQAAKSTKELLHLWEDMQKQGFLSYRLDAKALDDKAEEFKKMTLEEQQRILLSVLDHNHLYVNYSEMEDKDYAVSDKDKALNTSFYAAA